MGEVEKLDFFLTVQISEEATLEQKLCWFLTERLADLLAVMKDDAKTFPGELERIFLSCLAICVVGGGVRLDELSSRYRISPTDLPWTLLTVKDKTITAVSPQAKTAMQSFVESDKCVI